MLFGGAYYVCISIGVHVCGWVCTEHMQAHTHACGCQRWLPPTPPIWFVLFLFTCWECMSVCVPVGVCMCRPQVYARKLLPFHLFKTGSLTKAEVHQFGYTMWPASWNSPVSAFLRLGLPCLAFHVCAVDLNQGQDDSGPHAHLASTLPLSHLPSSIHLSCTESGVHWAARLTSQRAPATFPPSSPEPH